MWFKGQPWLSTRGGRKRGNMFAAGGGGKSNSFLNQYSLSLFWIKSFPYSLGVRCQEATFFNLKGRCELFKGRFCWIVWSEHFCQVNRTVSVNVFPLAGTLARWTCSSMHTSKVCVQHFTEWIRNWIRWSTCMDSSVFLNYWKEKLCAFPEGQVLYRHVVFCQVLVSVTESSL